MSLIVDLLLWIGLIYFFFINLWYTSYFNYINRKKFISAYFAVIFVGSFLNSLHIIHKIDQSHSFINVFKFKISQLQLQLLPPPFFNFFTTLLLLFLSILIFTLAFFDHHSTPSNNYNQTIHKSHHHDYKEPFSTNLIKSNKQNDTDLDQLLFLEYFSKNLCNLEAIWLVEYFKDVVILSGKNFSDLKE